jgi:hypothetical protein
MARNPEKIAVIAPAGSKPNGGYTWTIHGYIRQADGTYKSDGVYRPHGTWRKTSAIREARRSGYVVRNRYPTTA